MQDRHTDRLLLSPKVGEKPAGPWLRSLCECQQPPAMRSSWCLALYLSFRHVQFILATAVRRGHASSWFTGGDTEAKQLAQTPAAHPRSADSKQRSSPCPVQAALGVDADTQVGICKTQARGGKHSAKQWSQVCKEPLPCSTPGSCTGGDSGCL